MSQSLMEPHGLVFFGACLFVCFCFLEIFATSAFCPKLPKTNGKNKQTMKVYEWLAHVYSVTSHAYHPRVHFLLIFSWCVLMFSWFGHPSRKLPETMGGNASQPRLENRIGQLVSAWPLKFVFKTKSSNTCLVQQDFFPRIWHSLLFQNGLAYQGVVISQYYFPSTDYLYFFAFLFFLLWRHFHLDDHFARDIRHDDVYEELAPTTYCKTNKNANSHCPPLSKKLGLYYYYYYDYDHCYYYWVISGQANGNVLLWNVLNCMGLRGYGK